jgi:hypothetical protein
LKKQSFKMKVSSKENLWMWEAWKHKSESEKENEASFWKGVFGAGRFVRPGSGSSSCLCLALCLRVNMSLCQTKIFKKIWL